MVTKFQKLKNFPAIQVPSDSPSDYTLELSKFVDYHVNRYKRLTRKDKNGVRKSPEIDEVLMGRNTISLLHAIEMVLDNPEYVSISKENVDLLDKVASNINSIRKRLTTSTKSRNKK